MVVDPTFGADDPTPVEPTLGSEADWPERDALVEEAVRDDLTPEAVHVDEDIPADVEAQERDSDPDGDPEAADPGACEPYAEEDPSKPALNPDHELVLAAEVEDGEDFGELDDEAGADA